MQDPESGIIEPFPHNIGQGNSSAAVTQVEEDSDPADVVPTHSLTPKISQFQEETSGHESSRRKNPALRAAEWLNKKYPSVTRNITRAFYYIRGPRPHVPTPGVFLNKNAVHRTLTCLLAPVGLLDRTWKVRGREYDIFWEKYVLHFTQHLRKPWIFWLLAAVYLISLALFARANYFFTPPDSFVDCTAAYWKRLDECGLNGNECTPFFGASFEFRCPAGCMETILQNIRTVGDQEVDFVPLVVGGGDSNRTYRGDSFLCASAIHA